MGRPKVPLGTLLVAALAVTAASCGGDVTCAPAGTYVPTAVRSANPGDCPASVPQPTWDTLSVAANDQCGASTDNFVERRGGTNGEMWCGGDGTTVLTATKDGISGKSTVIAMACTTTMTCTANYDLTYARQ